jgi:tetratricopeptide (TPR) repeat protein
MMNGNGRKLLAFWLMLCFALTCVAKAQAQVRGGDEKAVQYLASYEPRLKETTAPAQRISLLLGLAPAAMAAGELEKAGKYAQELLTLSETQKRLVGLYGQSIHIGNIVLGHVALTKGNLAKAKEYLLAAGQTPGSPSLNTFGPNMLLAKELIEKGERDTVIAYLDLCARFWEQGGSKLEQWKATIQSGGVPNFGPNLSVGVSNWHHSR